MQESWNNGVLGGVHSVRFGFGNDRGVCLQAAQHDWPSAAAKQSWNGAGASFSTSAAASRPQNFLRCIFKRPVMFNKMNVKNGSKDLKNTHKSAAE